MQPSSLVFLVIIAVWAAYFVQYWVRRREHLATARSVDQFSESMRVLERRSPLPASNLSTPPPRSYAVTPARAARPQVLVKRAESAQAAVAAPTARLEDEPVGPRRSSSAVRRARAAIMLGALATLVVTVPLVALSLLPLPTLLVPVLAIGGAVAWARASARAQRRYRTSSGRARQAGRPTRQATPPVAHEVTRPDARVTRPDAGTEASEPGPSATPREELYDDQAVESGQRQPAPSGDQAAVQAAAPAAPAGLPARPLVDEDDIPLTWDPVPVPRPTYTMKSRVTRPAPASADLVGDADTEYAAYEEVPERRVAGA